MKAFRRNVGRSNGKPQRGAFVILLLALACVIEAPALLSNTAAVLFTRTAATNGPVNTGARAVTGALALAEFASGVIPWYMPPRLTLARILHRQNLWNQAIQQYDLINASTPSAISLLEEGEVLRQGGRPVQALRLYQRSGYIGALELTRSKDPVVVAADKRLADIGRLYADAARQNYLFSHWQDAIATGNEALRWTTDSSIVSQASYITALAYKAMGNSRLALASLWRSLASGPGVIGDPRYNLVCQLVLVNLGTETSTSLAGRTFADELRCLQWLGRDRSVVERGTAWLVAPLRASGDTTETMNLIQCLVWESSSRLGSQSATGGALVSQSSTLGCDFPFPGTLQAVWPPPALTAMLTYKVDQPTANGRYLLAVVANPLDLDLGLPVAMQFYWLASAPPDAVQPGTEVTVSFARETNLAPDANFAYEHFLRLPLQAVLPIGYVRDMYYAPPATHTLATATVGSHDQEVLRLDNQDGPASASSGLTSYSFPVDDRREYVQGGLVSSTDANPLIGRAWAGPHIPETYSYVPSSSLMNGWTRIAGLVRPPRGATSGVIWLLNFRALGLATFSQLLYVPIPDTAWPNHRP